MTFTYSAGTTAPTLAGLIEFNGVRINDGTYKSEHLGGLIDGPTYRVPMVPYPNADGAFVGTLIYKDPLTINIDGWFLLPDVNDFGAAIDYLQAAFDPAAGPLPLSYQLRGWSTARQVTAQVVGPITWHEPERVLKKVPVREFTIPLLAADPTVTVL